MALQPAPSASSSSRGEISIQPAYFTSSLFVNALREDIGLLVSTYSQAYATTTTTAGICSNPYALFKDLWKSLGWQWLHLKTIEPRSRESFLNVVTRLFLERTKATESLLVRVVALFGLYTFFMSRPSTSAATTDGVSTIPIPIDDYESLLALPESLDSYPEYQTCKDQVSYIVYSLTSRSAFVILPSSALHAQNPRALPREVVQLDSTEASGVEQSASKKTGRPSKAEKAQKSRLAISSLNNWTEANAFPARSVVKDMAGAPSASYIMGGDFLVFDQNGPRLEPLTHRILSERPMESLNDYRTKKDGLLSNLSSSEALVRANTKVLTRLKEIDAVAAEQGLEVGGEGGERSGLERVEKAVSFMHNGKKGLLGLLEGEGLDTGESST